MCCRALNANIDYFADLAVRFGEYGRLETIRFAVVFIRIATGFAFYEHCNGITDYSRVDVGGNVFLEFNNLLEALSLYCFRHIIG